MERGRRKLTETQLIEWCVAPNLPLHWKTKFTVADGPYLTNMLVIIQIMRAIEKQDENDKEARRGRNSHRKSNNKFNNKGKGRGKVQEKAKAKAME
eukprot:2257541-Ditylum_brightwellii.AAC.1